MKTPELPVELHPYDPRSVDDVLTVLSWLIGSAYRNKLLHGYDHIDTAFMAFLLDCGLPEEKIYRAFQLVFYSDYDEGRTQMMYDRAKTKLDSGEPVRGAGTFIHRLKEMNLSEIGKFANELNRATERNNNNKRVIDVTDVNVPDKKIIQPIPFPFHVFPEKIKRFTYQVSESFSIQPELTASLILAIISGAVGNTLRVSVKAGYETIPFLWLMIIGRSGYGKSPVMNYLMGPIESKQAKDSARYEEALRAYIRELRKAKETPGIDIPEEKPKAVHKIVSDITIEALADVYKGDHRGVIGHHDELSSFMLGMDQYRAKGNDLQHYLTLFYGKPWKIDRKSVSSFIHNTGLALIGGIQSEILPRIFESTTIKNGLFPRFLTINIEEGPSKFDRNGIKTEMLNFWDDLISQCYEIPLVCDEQGFVIPELLTFNDTALDMWIAFHDEFASTIPYMSTRLGPFCEKLKGYYSIKFIGLLHVLNCIDRGLSFNEKIKPDTVSDAIELTRYFAGQALMTLNLYDEAGRLTEFQVKLIKTLHRLQSEVKKGCLLFKRIDEAFNDDLPEVLKHKPERLAGLLKELGLKTEKGSHNIVYLVWEDDRIKNLFSRITITSITTITSKTIGDTESVIDVTDVIDKSQNGIPGNEKQEIINLEQVITLSENKAIKLISAGKINPIPETLEALSPEQREAYEERAVIMEYDGGLSREDAEREARCLYCMLTPGQRTLCEVKKPCPKT